MAHDSDTPQASRMAAPELQAVLSEALTVDLDWQGHRADCAIRLPHPASICTCHIADKQRAEKFARPIPTDGDTL